MRGVDGTEARVVAPADGAGIETIAEPGRFTVRTARHVGIDKSAFVGIKIGTRGFGMPLRLRVTGTVEVDVPRDARVVVTSAAGDVAVRDVLGGVTLKTAPGDISVKRAAGSITAEAASGDVSVAAVEPVSLDVRAVSGDVRARAPRFDRVTIETVSGDVELAGMFAPGEQHAVSTVSGDVELALVGRAHPRRAHGLRQRRMRAPRPPRRRRPEATARHRRRGRAARGAHDVGRCRGPRRQGRRRRRERARRTRMANARFGFPPVPPPPSMLPAASGPARSPAPRSARRLDALRSCRGGDPGRPARAGHRGHGAGDRGARRRADPETLTVLEALARGEIDVAEAERRLAGTAGTPRRRRADGGRPRWVTRSTTSFASWPTAASVPTRRPRSSTRWPRRERPPAVRARAPSRRATPAGPPGIGGRAARDASRGTRFAAFASASATAGPPRRLRVQVRDGGRTVIDLQLPGVLAELAGAVPGIPADYVDRVREALRTGVRGPIVDVTDEDGSGVTITID